MEEIERVVIKAMDETAEKESEEAREEAEHNDDKPGDGESGETGKKKVKKGEWFKRVVSTLIAIVTIMGAVVAWRASVAGSASGENDSSGLLALQNSEETKAVSDIQANGNEMAYINYLRDRILGTDMLNDSSVANAPPDMQDYMARQITETLDLSTTSERFFFTGIYLYPSNDTNNILPQYDYQRQVGEAYAQAQGNMDLNYQGHFDTSDALSNKSMFLLAMLIVLGIALWLFALSEVISNTVKYFTATGGLLYMFLGGLGAYLVDSGQASQDAVATLTWPVAWAMAGLTLVVVLVVWGLPLLRSRHPKPAVATSATIATTAPPALSIPPLYTPAPPQYAPPALPWPPSQPYPPTAYGQPPAASSPGYGPPPPNYGPPPPNYDPPPPGYLPTQAPQTPQVQKPTQATSSGTAVPADGRSRSESRSVKAAEVKKTDGKEAGEKEEEPFNRIVTVMIATVALIAALVAYLQADASNQSGSANRNAQQYATQALGQQTYGASEMSYQYEGLVQTWKQLQVLAYSATNHGDTAAATRYQDAMSQIAGLSDIFDKPYFDQNTDAVPNIYAYAANLYEIQAVGLSQRAIIQRGLHNVWDAKASVYIAHLTLLAVALALFGLALATSGFVRYIFAGAGLVIVGAAVIWATATYTQPITSINDQAVDDYAKGYGLEDGGNYDDAITAFSDALSIQPNYTDALFLRSFTYYTQAKNAYSNAFYQDEKGQSNDAQANYQLYTSKLEDTAKDLEAARAAGRDDFLVDNNLGFTYYLLGRFDDAVQMDRHILDKDPTLVNTRLNLGLALLAQGNDAAAELEYNTAIARTSDQINNARDKGQTVSSDIWYSLDLSTSKLFDLFLRVENQDYAHTLAPAKDKIVNPDDAALEAFSMMTKLRNSTSAFEYLAQHGQTPPDSQASVSIGAPTLSAIEQGQSSTVQGTTFPNTTTSVTMNFTYTGTLTGHSVVFKVYQDYDHLPGYDKITDNWQFGDSGSGFAVVNDPYQKFSETYVLPPGLWTVEMYVDYKMVRIGVFYVESPDETAQNQSQSPGSPSATPTPTP
jgi:tetratricopeptide (TPR) repeat protein